MSTTVHCPACNAPLELPEAIPAGKRLQCPDCGAAFSPPADADRAAELKTERARPEARTPAGSGTAAPRRRPSHREDDFGEDAPPRRGSGGSAVLVAAVVVIVLLVLGAGGAILLAFSRAVAVQDEQAMMAVNNGPPMMGPVPPGGLAMGGGPAFGGPGMAGAGMGFNVGAPAPEIEGQDLDGTPMKLSDFRGQVVVLDFWGDWCPLCKPAYTYQNHLINRMKGEPFVFLGVNCDATREQAQLVVKNQKIGWRSWYDGGGPNMGGLNFNKYGITAVPTAFVIDTKGIIQQRFDQQTNEVALDMAVDRVMALAEKRPANAPARWTAGSTAFSQLGDEVAVGAYRMRPPTGYVLEKLTPEPKHETYRWKGQPRQDGTVPVLEVSLEPAPPADRKLEDVLEKDLQAIPRPGLLGWNCSAAERGDVKGLIFARARWTLWQSPIKLKLSGYQYAAVDGDTLIRISCRDSMPTFGGAHDAAPLTFRRAPAE